MEDVARAKLDKKNHRLVFELHRSVTKVVLFRIKRTKLRHYILLPQQKSSQAY